MKEGQSHRRRKISTGQACLRVASNNRMTAWASLARLARSPYSLGLYPKMKYPAFPRGDYLHQFYGRFFRPMGTVFGDARGPLHSFSVFFDFFHDLFDFLFCMLGARLRERAHAFRIGNKFCGGIGRLRLQSRKIQNEYQRCGQKYGGRCQNYRFLDHTGSMCKRIPNMRSKRLLFQR